MLIDGKVSEDPVSCLDNKFWQRSDSPNNYTWKLSYGKESECSFKNDIESSTSCLKWAKRKYCTEKYVSWMKNKCAKTCCEY